MEAMRALAIGDRVLVLDSLKQIDIAAVEKDIPTEAPNVRNFDIFDFRSCRDSTLSRRMFSPPLDGPPVHPRPRRRRQNRLRRRQALRK